VLRELHGRLGRVLSLRLGLRTVVVSAHPADVAAILGKPAAFARPPAYWAVMEATVPGGVTALERRAHRAARRHIRGAFGPSLLGVWAPALRDAAGAMLADAERRRAAAAADPSPAAAVAISDVFRAAATRLLFTVAFGMAVDEAVVADMVSTSRDCVLAMMTDYLGYPLRQCRAVWPLRPRARLCAAVDALRWVYTPLVVARRAEAAADKAVRPPDLLDVLVATDGCDAGVDAAVSNVITFGLAGTATTAEAAAWTVVYLSSADGWRAKVVAEVDAAFAAGGGVLSVGAAAGLRALQAAWKETLRLSPAIGTFERVATAATSLPGSGVALPTGTPVMAYAAGAALDDSLWTDAAVFHPQRWEEAPPPREGEEPPTADTGTQGPAAGAAAPPPGAYVPFSVGVENCPGAFLADAEGVLLLAFLYHAYTVTLAVLRDAVRAVSGWAESARTDDPAGAPGNAAWGVPVHLTPRR